MTRRSGALALAAGTAVLAASMNVSAQVTRHGAGLILRGSAWSQPGGQGRLVWQSEDQHTLYDGAGFGGSISFVGPVSSALAVELSLGAAVRRIEEVKHELGTDTYVAATVPLLAGLRFHPLASGRGSAVHAYVSAGGGPYWVGDVVELDSGASEDVTADFRHELGGYVGAGVDVMITGWFGLNFDVKRHFVDFRTHYERSGFEYSTGLMFLWGRRRYGR
jgi:outer membrane protein W